MVYQITNVYAITVIAILGGCLFGFDISSQAAVIATPQYKLFYGGSPQGPTSSQQGGITAAMPAGSFFGALSSGIVSDRVGRKYAIMIGAGIWIVGSALVSSSQSIAALVVGRFTNGFAVGICSAQVPVYISELAPTRLRGILVGLQQWAITWGILIMFYMCYASSFMEGTISFRLPWALQSVPGFLLLFGLVFTPRSPRWLANKGRWEECLQVLAAVHGKGDRNNPSVQSQYQELRDIVQAEQASSAVRFSELFSQKMIPRTSIGCFCQIWSQLTGMNVMMYYIVYIFGMAGLSGNANLMSSSIQYIINVIMTLPGLYLIDKVGRRKLLLGGSITMMAMLFSVAGVMGSYGNSVPEVNRRSPQESWVVKGPASKAIIALTYLFVASFSCTWGPVSWVYTAEVYPLRLRGKGAALATSFNWLFNFVLGYFVPVAFENIQWKTYLIFGMFCFAMTIHVFLSFPETKMKSLEEVEELFMEGSPGWKQLRSIFKCSNENNTFPTEGIISQFSGIKGESAQISKLALQTEHEESVKLC